MLLQPENILPSNKHGQKPENVLSKVTNTWMFRGDCVSLCLMWEEQVRVHQFYDPAYCSCCFRNFFSMNAIQKYTSAFLFFAFLAHSLHGSTRQAAVGFIFGKAALIYLSPCDISACQSTD